MSENPNLYDPIRAQAEAAEMQRLAGEKPTAEEFDKVQEQAQKHVDSIFGPKEKKEDGEEIILTPEQKSTRKRIIETLMYTVSRDGMSELLRIKNNCGLSAHQLNEIVNSPEVQKAINYRASKLFEDIFSYRIDDIFEIQKALGLPDDDFINSPAIQEAAKKGAIFYISHGLPDKAIEIIKRLHLPDSFISSSEVLEVAKETIVESFSYFGEPYRAIEINKKLDLPDDIVNSPEVREAAKKKIIKEMAFGNVHNAIELKNEFIAQEDFDSSPEFQKALEEGLYRKVSNGDVYDVIKIKNELGLPEGFSNLPEVQEAVREGLIRKLGHGGYYTEDVRHYFEIIKALNIPRDFADSPEFQEAAKKEIILMVEKRAFSWAIRIKNELNVSGDIIQKAIKNKILEDLSNGYILYSKEEIEKNPDLEETKEAIKGSLMDSLANVDTQNVEKILKIFNISDLIIQEAAKKVLIDKLSSGDINTTNRIKSAFNYLLVEVIKLPEIQEAAKKAVLNKASAGEISEALEIKKSFNLSEGVFQLSDMRQSDEECASKINPNNLISFVKHLGKDFDTLLPMPLTSEKAIEMILDNLESNDDLADYFLENAGNYHDKEWAGKGMLVAVSHYSVANKFINGIENFSWKNEPWVQDVIEKANKTLAEHGAQFGDGEHDYSYSHGSEGFRESNPYENNPWVFNKQQAVLTDALTDIMRGKINPRRMKDLNINQSEIEPLLAKINEKIKESYEKFITRFQSNSKINDDDKKALASPESLAVKMTPFFDLSNNLQYFAIRYLVQSIGGDLNRISDLRESLNNMDGVLEEGFKKYIKVHEVDIPLYDKLYEEFDNLRETGRYPTEVFLGRDGVYAWIGRWAQDIARRKKLGPEGRKKLQKMGDIIEINPQYLVYPRYFRDNLDYDTKRQFLEQERITPDADPLFYDTGYTGTIPEQIMRVMDFDDEDIERRIRLLSAPSVHRRVKGIPENARSEIIEYIEHNAKTENTAEGLIIDEETGKIHHIAQPTSPEEQFYYMMIKQAIARHYWLQEKLYHEPSGNVGVDSENYSIRIRQEYLDLLPKEFIENPKKFFAESGTLLKGGKGEGEYPDEEIISFELSDGTEIVAKKIELRKAKESRKEFSILISAKKVGLPTAEPVGFMSGKKEVDGSYLLMKKVEGISGRKFEKHLRESGKFSDEKINAIIQDVSEKNKELADLFRDKLKIDKRWRIKDTIIEFDEDSGTVVNVTPIDWERAEDFDANNPKKVDNIDNIVE
ncbi:hypothetical protein HYV44_01430 [Candidatus Microgenomates bacterium]|nr:hypothetical protein [Candidatus Microgenomates bacterium]